MEESTITRKENTGSKAKKIAIISASGVVAAAVVIALLFTLIIPAIRFNNADKLFNEGKYEEAMKIYGELGDFSNSSQRIVVLNGIEKIDNNDFETAIQDILSAGIPVKLTYDIGGGDFAGDAYIYNSPKDWVLSKTLSTSGTVAVSPETAEPEPTTEYTYNSSDDFDGIKTPGRNGYRFVEWALEEYNYQVDGTFELKLRAVWSEKEYVIRYDLAGGNFDTNGFFEYGADDETFTLINPTKKGYTFIGWTGTDLAEPTVSVTIEKGSFGDKEYTANWKVNSYTVTLNPSGGTVSETSFVTVYNQAFTLPTPTKAGYIFDGWFSGSTEYVSGFWTEPSNVTLVAKWKVDGYTLTFADTDPAGIKVTFNENYMGAESTVVKLTDRGFLTYPKIPVREGYVFTGWYKDSACKTKYDFTGKVNGDMTLYAGWTAQKVSSVHTNVNIIPVIYNSVGNYYGISAEGTSSSAQKYIYLTANESGAHKIYYKNSSASYATNIGITNLTTNATIKSPAACSSEAYEAVEFTCNAGDVIAIAIYRASTANASDYGTAYFYFEGFNDVVSTAEAEIAETEYVKGAEYSKEITYGSNFTLPNSERLGYKFLGWFNGTEKVNAGIWNYASDIEIAAKWEALKYTVTLDANGGSVSSGTVIVTYDQEFTLPTPTKAGYNFEGWFNGNTQYAGGTWTGLGDVTLTAKWKAKTYTITYGDIAERLPEVKVTFNYNYTGTMPSVIRLTNNQTLEYPTNPTREGYVFTGWYKDSACTVLYDFTGNINTNMTLYAGWRSCAVITNSSAYAWSLSSGVLTSTNKTDSSSSEYRITATSPVTITFEYKTSSESGWDYLYIKKNGSTLTECSGETSYVPYSVTLGAGDYLSFVYTKDGSQSRGNDCAYISDLTYVSDVSYTSTAKAVCSDEEGYIYEQGESATANVTFGTSYELVVPTRQGYTFLGWYRGNTKIEAGVWTYDADITLTAKWEACKNTITLDAVGGTVSPGTLTVTYDEEFTLPTPTKAYHTFEGWFVGTVEYVSGIWQGLDDITLVAKWKADEYTVTFDDAKRDDVVVTFNLNYSGATPSIVTLPDGDVLDYPTVPTRTGYVFTGWYTTSACTTRYDFTGAITRDTTLYAGWEAQKTTSVYSNTNIDPVIFNSSGNAGNLSVSSNTSSTAQYYFYFTANESGTHRVYYKNSYSSSSYAAYIGITNLTTGETIKTTARYASTAYEYAEFDCDAGDVIVINIYKSTYSTTIYLYFEGFGNVTSSAFARSEEFLYDTDAFVEETVEYGMEITLPALSKQGYTFLGWFNGTTKVESGAWRIASDVTLTPQWEAAKNTITFDADGGTVSSDTLTVTYNEAFTLPTPTKTGYTFAGWFDGSTEYTDGIWTEFDDVTLTAEWTANTYNLTLYGSVKKDITVTFDKNYSGSTPSNVVLKDGDILDYPAVPTRTSYVFTGWYKDSACTTRYDFTGTITSDTTLYAGWKAQKTTSVYSNTNIIPVNFNSSGNAYSVSSASTSSTAQKYIYLTANESGTHRVYYKNSYANTYYGTYIGVTNLTTNTTIKSTARYASTAYAYVEFDCDAGDVIVINIYKYSSSATAYFYFEGFSGVTSSAEAASSEYLYTNGSMESISVTYGTSFTLPTLTRQGYTFLGWYNGNTKVESGVWDITSDVIVTPKWEGVTYYDVTFEDTVCSVYRINVTYNYNYAGSTNTVVQIENGDVLEYPVIPTRSGYLFSGWYTEPSCTNKYSFSGDITDDITLYADWSTYTTDNNSAYPWNVSGGNLTSTNKSDNSSSSYTITASSSVIISFQYKTSSESNYDKLLIKKNGSELKNCSGETEYVTYSVTLEAGDTLTFTYQKDGSVSNGSDCAYITDLVIASNETATSTATAQCTQITYVYSEGKSITLSVEYGEMFTMPTATREGYTFLGWYNGATKVETGAWSIASDVTLTAQWE